MQGGDLVLSTGYCLDFEMLALHSKWRQMNLSLGLSMIEEVCHTSP